MNRTRVKNVALGSVVSSVSSYLVLVASARVLSPDDYGKFSIFWALVFFFSAVSVSIELEASRLAARLTHSGVRQVEKNFLIVGIFVASFSTIVYVALGSRAYEISTLEMMAGAIAIILVVPMGVVRGTLIGQDRFREYSLLIAAEGAARLLAFLVVLLAGNVSLQHIEIVIVIGFLCWLPWARSLGSAVALEPIKTTFKNSLLLMFLSLGSAFFLVGIPWVISGNPEVSLTEIAIFSASAMVARVPLLVFSSVQALLIPHFLRKRMGSQEAIDNGLTVKLIAVATASVLLAFLLGPRVITLAFGDFYVVDQITFALLVISSWMLVWHLVNVANLVSLNKHLFAGLSWLPGVSISAILLSMWASDISSVTYSMMLGSAACLIVSQTLVKKPKPARRLD